MKLRLSLALIITSLNFLCSCAQESEVSGNINIDNFPVIDGSDSTDPLRSILMCKMLGFDYTWERRPFTPDPKADIKIVMPVYTCTEEEQHHLRNHCLKQSNTHQSFINLIDGTVELIITARSISRDERVYANEKDVSLIEKPIAKDALAFMVNPANPVNNLTVSQLQGIYTGEITNWKEVGGNDEEIKPYVRNRNSGSQEKFETLVMAGLEIKEFPELQVGKTMMSPYYQLEEDTQGIGYSPFYYYSVIVDNESTKAIGINDIAMTKENIENGSYPYTTNIYAAVRSDIDRSSEAYRLFELLTTAKGQDIIEESGYVPLNEASAVPNIYVDSENTPVSTTYMDLNGRACKRSKKGILIKTDMYADGKTVSHKVVIK